MVAWEEEGKLEKRQREKREMAHVARAGVLLAGVWCGRMCSTATKGSTKQYSCKFIICAVCLFFTNEKNSCRPSLEKQAPPPLFLYREVVLVDGVRCLGFGLSVFCFPSVCCAVGQISLEGTHRLLSSVASSFLFLFFSTVVGGHRTYV